MTTTEILNKWFTNKEEYLVWRAAWRENYKALSQQIRETKQERHTTKDAHTRAWSSYQCYCLRLKAKAQMEIRENSKVEAQRQYLAAKAAMEASKAAA